MILATCLLLLGLTLLLKGSDWLIDGSCSIAKRAGISQLIIGLTLVSFGTSLPEFFINIVSRIKGESDITLGDILGSNIANILLVLGLSAVIRPLTFKRSTMILEIPYAFAAAVVLALLLMNGQEAMAGSFHGLTRADGLVLLVLFSLFLFYVFRLQKTGIVDKIEPLTHPCPPGRSIVMVLAGVPALALGAKWVVDGAMFIASSLGISEAVIGLTIVAVGTSLPELATSIVASIKKKSDIAVGNVVGSNIFNICWILGVSSSVSPLSIPRSYFFDVGVIIFVTALLFLSIFLGKRGVIGRWNGVFFVFLYAAYVFSLAMRSSGAGSSH